jgi:hypothetical protein
MEQQQEHIRQFHVNVPEDPIINAIFAMYILLTLFSLY